MIFFLQAEDGIRDIGVTGVQTCALPIFSSYRPHPLDAVWPRVRAGVGASSCSSNLPVVGHADEAPARHLPNGCLHTRAAERGNPQLQPRRRIRSEEHTSELQSRQYLVCRLLLDK